METIVFITLTVVIFTYSNSSAAEGCAEIQIKDRFEGSQKIWIGR